MSSTQHIRRLYLICPEARVAAFNTWAASNLQEPGTGNWLSVGLNPTGDTALPVTHRHFCAALTEEDLKRILIRLCVLAALTQPSNWDSLSAVQKAQWIADNRPLIKAVTGVWFSVSANDGNWDNFNAIRIAEGLARRESII